MRELSANSSPWQAGPAASIMLAGFVFKRKKKSETQKHVWGKEKNKTPSAAMFRVLYTV